MKIKMGIYDSPREQKRDFFTVDNWKTNIAVFGDSGSGKTVFLKTLIMMLYNADKKAKKHMNDIYIIDFGQGMSSFASIGNVCAYFNRSNEEYIKSVFTTIEERLNEISEIIGDMTYQAYAEKYPEKCPAHITLIIDNITPFLRDENYSYYREQLETLCRDGVIKGLNVIITANNLIGIHSRLLSNFEQKIAFSMLDEDYRTLFNTKTDRPVNVPGRCLVNIGPYVHECQIFLPYNDMDYDNNQEHSLAEKKQHPRRMHALPAVITMENIARHCRNGKINSRTDSELLFGLDYRKSEPVTLDTDNVRAVAVYNKKSRTGEKMNFLDGMLGQLKDKAPDIRFVFFDDSRKEMDKLYDKYSHQSAITYSVLEFISYIIEEGYIKMKYPPVGKECAEIKINPPTVFLIQSKSFYRDNSHANNLRKWVFEEMLDNADKYNYMFVFTDVPNIVDKGKYDVINGAMDAAFLFDDIAEFRASRGEHSVFGILNPDELKTEYAKCSKYDGYYYNVQEDDLKKLKFIKF